jgi:hypothetical protein
MFEGLAVKVEGVSDALVDLNVGARFVGADTTLPLLQGQQWHVDR